MASALCTKVNKKKKIIPAMVCSLLLSNKQLRRSSLVSTDFEAIHMLIFNPLTLINKSQERILRFTMSDRWVCGSGCWTQGQMEGSAVYRTRRWSPQRPLQSPCGTATGTNWEEPGSNHLLGRSGGKGTHVKTKTREILIPAKKTQCECLLLTYLLKNCWN